MEESWDKAFESDKVVRAEIIRELLEQNDIPAVILNKTDTAYHWLGKWEVHVLSHDLTKAQNIINNEGPFTESE